MLSYNSDPIPCSNLLYLSIFKTLLSKYSATLKDNKFKMKKIFFLAFVAIGINVSAQKGASPINFPKGKKLEMVAQTKAVISQEMMGQSMDINVNSTITRAFDIEDVKNGTAKIEHKVKRLQFSFDAMGQQQSFDSDKEEDVKGEMGKAFEKSLKNKYSMEVDANGNIVAVKPDDDNANKTEEKDNADMMGNMMSQFAEGLEVPKVGDVISLKLNTKGNLAKGQSWSDSLTGGVETGTIKYTVADVTNADVLIDYLSEAVTKKSQDVGGMAMDVDLKNKTTGQITLDKKTGLLKKRTIESQGSGTMEVAGQSIPMSSKVSGTITVNGL